MSAVSSHAASAATIDPTCTSSTSPPDARAIRTVRLGLIGLGMVGRGLLASLERTRAALAAQEGLEIVPVVALVRDLARGAAAAATHLRLTDDPRAFADARPDVVIEATGDVAGVLPIVAGLLHRGIPVVTANKALVAEHGAALARIAASHGTVFLFEASVAAAVPILRVLALTLRTTTVTTVTAILNTTSHVVLRAVGLGAAIEAAVDHARRAGFAERDVHDDLSGLDAARKLTILAAALGCDLPLANIAITTCDDITPAVCARAAADGRVIRQIARLELSTAGVHAWVAPALVRLTHPLATLATDASGVVLEDISGAEFVFAGPGAGAIPTATALIDDVLWAVNGGGAPRPRPAAFVVCAATPAGPNEATPPGAAGRSGPVAGALRVIERAVAP